MSTTFAASLAQFANMTKQNIRYCLNEGVQDVVEAMLTPQQAISAGATTFERGKIPVDTSALINSLTINGEAAGAEPTVDLQGGGIDTFEFQTPYAARIEFGFTGTDSAGRQFNQAGRFFVTDNAPKFVDGVARAAAEVSKK